jgi:hypothetical protein
MATLRDCELSATQSPLFYERVSAGPLGYCKLVGVILLLGKSYEYHAIIDCLLRRDVAKWLRKQLVYKNTPEGVKNYVRLNRKHNEHSPRTPYSLAKVRNPKRSVRPQSRMQPKASK